MTITYALIQMLEKAGLGIAIYQVFSSRVSMHGKKSIGKQGREYLG